MAMREIPDTCFVTDLAVLPLRDVVVFPHMVIPLFVGRKKSITALERAMESGKQIMLVAQMSASDDDPTPEQIHRIARSRASCNCSNYQTGQ